MKFHFNVLIDFERNPLNAFDDELDLQDLPLCR